ncbi:hypothetical protein BVAVS116_H0039 (plasmid) [Borreliella valaisiana VS116]|uniref:Uncharacterized protein n=1 Tax=Borreliella valaisiana VS116 TaxID=445987 RepID=C0R996_BORVA|nr:hypothetical protein BVAVS116_H0039 [Borreliella valaisiana VS116]
MKLSVAKHCVLSDIKRAFINNFKKLGNGVDPNSLLPLF